VTFIALFALFAIMVMQKNSAGLARDQKLVEPGLAERVEFESDNLRDYTRWNESSAQRLILINGTSILLHMQWYC